MSAIIQLLQPPECGIPCFIDTIYRQFQLQPKLLRQQGEGKKKKQATVQIIPTTQHILDNYDDLTVEEKNHLWKLVMQKATVYRSRDDKLTVNIYPNLPK